MNSYIKNDILLENRFIIFPLCILLFQTILIIALIIIVNNIFSANISEVTQVVDANVPLIKIKYNNIPIDISMANVPLKYFTELDQCLDLNDEQFFLNCDEKGIRSINGVRNSELIMKSVPNLQIFQNSLKLIKLWAKNQSIYSSLQGYLGGISWAILVAKICQMYPNYSVIGIVERFFFIYANFNWEDIPIKLENFDNQNHKLGDFQWNQNKDKHIMMIITPAFPQMNTSHTICTSTLQLIQKKLTLANKHIRQAGGVNLSLFEKSIFFKDYSSFIEIRIVAKNLQEFIYWRGSVESKLRKLTRYFEMSQLSQDLNFDLYPISFELKDQEYQYCVAFFYGLSAKPIPDDNDTDQIVLDISPPICQFVNCLDSFNQGPLPETVNIKFKCQKTCEIDEAVFIQELGEVPEWTKRQSPVENQFPPFDEYLSFQDNKQKFPMDIFYDNKESMRPDSRGKKSTNLRKNSQKNNVQYIEKFDQYKNDQDKNVKKDLIPGDKQSNKDIYLSDFDIKPARGNRKQNQKR